MSEPFLGQICPFGFNFAPRGWAMCNGQILPIAQNTALFSLLGTTYGGNGQTTFALPNLQSRVPLHFGQGAGLSSYSLGQAAGTESVTLLQNNMPQMPVNLPITATLKTSNEEGDNARPAGRFPAALTSGSGYVSATDNSTMAAGAVTGNVSGIVGGGSQPVPVLQPYLAINFCIALEGIFPSRN